MTVIIVTFPPVDPPGCKLQHCERPSTKCSYPTVTQPGPYVKTQNSDPPEGICLIVSFFSFSLYGESSFFQKR